MSEGEDTQDFLPAHFEVAVCPFAGRSRSIRLGGGELICEAPPQRSSRVRPPPEAWRIFWREMEILGLWQWPAIHQPEHDGVLYDGTQWRVAISHGGRRVRSAGRYGSESPQFRRFRQSLQRLTGGMPFG